MKKRIAVVLSGCGFKDGAEITEAVSSLIALSEFETEVEVFAPDMPFSSKDHVTDTTGEERNILRESSRISRGKITPLTGLDPINFEALFFPGGFGAALHLCNWATNGASCEVDPEVQRIIETFFRLKKPIGAVCIAPVLLAKILGKDGINVTIGTDKETAREIEKTGATHSDCRVENCIIDEPNKIVTSPAYMADATEFQVYTGVRQTIKELVNLC